MSDPTPLDAAWCRDHPLPDCAEGTDKNSRGRVLAAGGSLACPGALLLTAEAALRAGAGKVQMATVAPAALMLGVLMPEAAVVPLPVDEAGEIAADAADALRRGCGRSDVLVLGPGMGDRDSAGRLVAALLGEPLDAAVVLDAAAVACAGPHGACLKAQAGRLVLTPHLGEMAALTGRDADDIARDPARAAGDAARDFGAVVALKGAETVVAAPDGTVLRYAGGGAGLATGGSGDVLAGLVGGLLARGMEPLAATAWGVRLHGEAGRMLAARGGRLGFLARELPPLVPGIMAAG